MKRILLLLLILPLTGCIGRAMEQAHRTEGEYLLEYQAKADEIFVGTMANWKAERKNHLDTIQAYAIEKDKDAEGNIPVARLAELREFRKDLEKKDVVKFAEVEKKWTDNHKWFDSAMQLHQSLSKWLGALRLF